MKFLFPLLVFVLLPTFIFAQFKPMDKGLTIYVTDGTDLGTNSKSRLTPKGYNIRANKKSGKSRKAESGARFTDIIRPLGMANSIQAAAFIDRPTYGKIGFLLIFCVNDSIGGRQGSIYENGEVYYGVYRLVRPKSSEDEVVPKGMTNYKLSGLVFILGVS